MRTTVINLYGGPGCGKSTTAAGLFYEMKRAGMSVELVREYVKDWAWEGRTPSAYDQAHFFGEQSRRESILYGKVEYIITDSPLLLSLLYDDHGVVGPAALSFMDLARKTHDVRYLHYVLKRTKGYDPAGRYQTEQQAIELDDRVRDLLLARSIPFVAVNVPDPVKVATMVNYVLQEAL